MDNIVQQVEKWFAENGPILSESFPKVNLHLMCARDSVHGQVAIQVDGPSAGATVSFWNKGDVMAIGIDKIRKQEFSFDDRVLTPDDDVRLLLRSYFDRLRALANNERTE